MILKIRFTARGCRCENCRFMFNVRWLGARMFSFGRFRMIVGEFK